MKDAASKIIELCLRNRGLRSALEALEAGESLLMEGLFSSPKALFFHLAEMTLGKHLLIISGETQDLGSLFQDLEFFSRRPLLEFPAWETLPNENIPPSPDIVGARYTVLEKIKDVKEPLIILTSPQALLQKIVQKPVFENLTVTLEEKSTYPFQDLIDKLIEMGYERRSVASDKGEFAVRGCIIDIFPVSCPDPYRIEFFGDDIESLRRFDPIGQKSVERVDRFSVTPARELELLEKIKYQGTLLDYLGKDTLVVLDDLLAIEDRLSGVAAQLESPPPSFSTVQELFDAIEPLTKIFLTKGELEELTEVKTSRPKRQSYYAEESQHSISFEMFRRPFNAIRFNHPFKPIEALLSDEEAGEGLQGEEILLSLGRLSSDASLFLLNTNESDKSTLAKRLADGAVSLPAETDISLGYLSNGFGLQDPSLLVIPTTEITNRRRIRRQKMRSTYHFTPSDFFDLTKGELVVHLQHGIGKYLGQEKQKDIHGHEKEHLLIEYADNSRLFVPMHQMHLVTKYIGATDDIPKLHEIGGTRWAKTREKTEKAIVGYAKDLLELYAKREFKGGFSFFEDSADMRAFEEEFPYEETEDQLEAIARVKEDMRSAKAMDRLICGDVGYGKTEVAMRASFKAVVDGGKQVAMLVPTTVLAMQHYENFVERMRNFPVRIGILSRFQSIKEQKRTIEGVFDGSVDILIGTHRIISGDILFKDLGLVIIDEEQRFGVKAKEHLKRIKVGVDCLTLSATPIPRTLYLSLSGARDMSVINTPPQDRLPIKTAITEPTDQVIKTALLRELSRDGQAFFIHNRVETLPDVVIRLQKLLPKARIASVHGQMHAEEIDTMFHAFKSGKIDILAATSIIESGIDIPNANTILIDRADHFGLAELYQLRGRVGRWNRRAYAYFLVNRLHALPELTRKRLTALAESVGFGGGMKLAMRDLEIRGAGDILGTEQSGHVASIGFHFYCKLLKRTIKALQGDKVPFLVETKIDLPYEAFIPESYVDTSSLRMEIYQRIGEAEDFETLEALWSEMRDRFGPQPTPVKTLYHLSRIRLHAAKKGYTYIKLDNVSLLAEKSRGREILESKRILVGKKPLIDALEAKILTTL